MFRRRFFSTALAFLLVGTLLLAGCFLLARAGWSQGYTAGLQAGGAEVAPIAPYGFYGPLTLGIFPLLCGFGLLFFLGLFAFRFMLFGRRGWGWHKYGGSGDEPWMGPWRHGHRPPWKPEPGEGEEKAEATRGEPADPAIVA